MQFGNLPISSSSCEKKYIEDFILKHQLLFEICAHEVCEKFVYKHSETIAFVKN